MCTVKCAYQGKLIMPLPQKAHVLVEKNLVKQKYMKPFSSLIK